MKRTKALSMFSGGLDSILATKLIMNQDIDVEAINFQGFFCSCKGSGLNVAETAKQLGVPLKVVTVGNDYLAMLRNPKHGYGKNMNPCVDCKIFMLKNAKKYARQIGAAFIFTGEVLNERPMSQHFQALKMIEEESGLEGRLLRPLSAKLLLETIVEKKGIVKRNQLLGIRGRSRKPQIKLAKELGISSFPSPAGGCLLTEVEFSVRLRDLFNHRKRFSVDDVALLRVGRHFRFGENKIIVGRDEKENKTLLKEKRRHDSVFEASATPGPTTILQGKKTKKAIELAGSLTAFYSDRETDTVRVSYGKERLDKSLTAKVPSQTEIENLRV
jgi:tRNA-specific 2-thiouridylase